MATALPGYPRLVTNGGGRYDTYSSDYASRSRGVLGESRQDHRLEDKELVVGLVVENVPAAFAHTMPGNTGVVNERVNTTPIAVAFEPRKPPRSHLCARR